MIIYQTGKSEENHDLVRVGVIPTDECVATCGRESMCSLLFMRGVKPVDVCEHACTCEQL